MNKNNQRNDILFVLMFILLVGVVALFNYFADPYQILNAPVIKGFNDNKIHKLTNKRTIIYSDIKLNSKNKTKAFVGNCLLEQNKELPNDVAFFTIPVVKTEEVFDVIQNIHLNAPQIKTIYWGMYFDDLYNAQNDNFGEKFAYSDEKNINIHDCINLFFSFNTTKYSIETVLASFQNKNNNDVLIYPYKELANKEYSRDLDFHELEKVKKAVLYAKENDINLILYYSPIHITKKVHIYLSGRWETWKKLKRELANITPYYDYSLCNDFNSTLLDENNANYVDSIHLQKDFEMLIINDLLFGDFKLGTYVSPQNVDELSLKDEKCIKAFIHQNPKLCEKINHLQKSDRQIFVKFNGAEK